MSAVAGRYGWRGPAGTQPHLVGRKLDDIHQEKGGSPVRNLIVKAVLAAVAAATASTITDRVADGSVDVALLEHAGYGAIAAALVVLHQWATSEPDNG